MRWTWRRVSYNAEEQSSWILLLLKLIRHLLKSVPCWFLSPPGSFKIFFLCLVFCNFNMLCLYVVGLLFLFLFCLFLHLSCWMLSELPEFVVWKVLSHCYFKHFFCAFSLFSSTGIPIMMRMLHLIKLSQSSCMFCSFFRHFFLSLHFSLGVFIDLSSCLLILSLAMFSLLMSPSRTFFISVTAFCISSIFGLYFTLVKIVYIWSVQRDDLIHIYIVKWFL